jgi:hypothetical protein
MSPGVGHWRDLPRSGRKGSDMTRLLGAVVLLLVLAGCGGDPKADPTTTPSTPATSPASTTPSPPVMPEAAKANTKAGAVAFVRYYVELINYAQRTGVIDELAKIEDAACASCTKVRETLTDIYGSGGHIQGGDWTAKVQSAAPRPDLHAWSVFADVRYGPQVVSRSGEKTPLKGGQSPMTFVVRQMKTGWTVLRWSRGS